MIGIILLGGSGTRLKPFTNVSSKHLLPIFMLPMFYYPMSFLIDIGIKTFILVINEEDQLHFEKLLGDGSSLGLKIFYRIQKKPEGIPSAIQEAIKFKDDFNEDIFVSLGDNILISSDTVHFINSKKFDRSKALNLTFYVSDPKQFGVVSFGDKPYIVEKPKSPPSNYAVTGFYYYPKNVLHKLSKLQPSKRLETEITDFNNILLEENALNFYKIKRGSLWTDAGSFSDFQSISNYMYTIYNMQGLLYGSIDEICFRKGLIDEDTYKKRIKNIYSENSDIGKYLISILSS